MSTPLEIIVTGNTSGATSSLKSVQAELGKTVVEAQKTDSAIDVLGKNFQQLSSKGGNSLAVLATKLETLKAAMFNEKDVSRIGAFNLQIQNTEKEIAQLSNVGKTGFDNLGNAIEKTGNPLSKAFGAVRQLAYVLPGVGIAGIIGFATGPIIDYIKSLSNANDAQNRLIDALSEARGSVAGEVTELKTLVSIARDTSLSYEARTQAIKELNKEYPQFHNNVTLENINTRTVTKAIDNEIEAIKRRSQAKAIEKLIDEESVKLEKAKLFNPDINASQVTGTFTDFLGGISEALGAPGLIGTRTALHEALVDPIKEAQKNIDFFSKKLLDINTEGAKAGTLFDPRKLPKTKKDGKQDDPFTVSLQDIQDNYKDALALVEGNQIAELVATKNFLEEKKALLEKYGKYEGQNNLEISKNNLKIFRHFFANTEPVIVPFEIQFESQQIKERLENAYKTQFAPKEQNDPIQKITPLNPFANAGDVERLFKIAKLVGSGVSKKFAEGLGTVKFEEFYNKTENLFKNLSGIVSSTLSEVLAGIGESIGKLATGTGGLKELFGGLLSTIANGLKQFGKSLIEYGVGLKIIKLARLTPGAAIIGGIALTAFASALQASIPKFATGVSNFAGGAALVGERGPELVSLPKGSNVIPNHQISGYFGKEGFVASYVIKGSDLVTILNRQQATNSRNG